MLRCFRIHRCLSLFQSGLVTGAGDTIGIIASLGGARLLVFSSCRMRSVRDATGVWIFNDGSGRNNVSVIGVGHGISLFKSGNNAARPRTHIHPCKECGRRLCHPDLAGKSPLACHTLVRRSSISSILSWWNRRARTSAKALKSTTRKGPLQLDQREPQFLQATRSLRSFSILKIRPELDQPPCQPEKGIGANADCKTQNNITSHDA